VQVKIAFTRAVIYVYVFKYRLDCLITWVSCLQNVFLYNLQTGPCSVNERTDGKSGHYRRQVTAGKREGDDKERRRL